MDDDTKELFKFLDALPFAIETLADEFVIKNQPLSDVSAVNDLLEFIHSGDNTGAVNEYLAEKQIELAEQRKVLGISKYDTIDELLDGGADMFQKAIDTGDKRRIAECLEMKVIPDYFIEANAKGIKLKKTGRNKNEWDVVTTVAMQTEYLKQLTYAIESGDFEKKVNFKGEVKNKTAMETARIRTGKLFKNDSHVGYYTEKSVKNILIFAETLRLKAEIK